MKKIVSNILIVSTQLLVGGLFLLMLFSDNKADNTVVIVKNNNLNKMADSVSDLFIEDLKVVSLIDETLEEELISQEEKEEQEKLLQEQAKALEEEKKKQEEEQKKLEEEEAKKNAESALIDNSVEALQAYAYDLVINTYCWSESDYTALVTLWNRESGWNYSASNGSAYGIPQALPASKMASAGSDYLTNGQTQIRWGLEYIKSTYSTPSLAWDHFQTYKWY